MGLPLLPADNLPTNTSITSSDLVIITDSYDSTTARELSKQIEISELSKYLSSNSPKVQRTKKIKIPIDTVITQGQYHAFIIDIKPLYKEDWSIIPARLKFIKDGYHYTDNNIKPSYIIEDTGQLVIAIPAADLEMAGIWSVKMYDIHSRIYESSAWKLTVLPAMTPTATSSPSITTTSTATFIPAPTVTPTIAETPTSTPVGRWWWNSPGNISIYVDTTSTDAFNMELPGSSHVIDRSNYTVVDDIKQALYDGLFSTDNPGISQISNTVASDYFHKPGYEVDPATGNSIVTRTKGGIPSSDWIATYEIDSADLETGWYGMTYTLPAAGGYSDNEFSDMTNNPSANILNGYLYTKYNDQYSASTWYDDNDYATIQKLWHLPGVTAFIQVTVPSIHAWNVAGDFSNAIFNDV